MSEIQKTKTNFMFRFSILKSTDRIDELIFIATQILFQTFACFCCCCCYLVAFPFHRKYQTEIFFPVGSFKEIFFLHFIKFYYYYKKKVRCCFEFFFWLNFIFDYLCWVVSSATDVVIFFLLSF